LRTPKQGGYLTPSSLRRRRLGGCRSRGPHAAKIAGAIAGSASAPARAVPVFGEEDGGQALAVIRDAAVADVCM
jgi:hypothetical protein